MAIKSRKLLKEKNKHLERLVRYYQSLLKQANRSIKNWQELYYPVRDECMELRYRVRCLEEEIEKMKGDT